jgi:trimeric autotransporter adhesin
MSKNLTRKGLAFAALVALGSTLFAGAPALASDDQITLTPNGGTATNATTTSIIGAGITMQGTVNPSLVANVATNTLQADVSRLVYLVTNPAGATLQVTTDGVVTDANEFQAFDADGALTGAAAAIPTNITATKFVIRAGKGTDGNKPTFGNLFINSTSSSAVSLTVQALVDGDGDAVVDSFEPRSTAKTVTLLPLSSVSATTSIVQLQRTALNPATPADVDTQGERDQFGFTARVVYGSSVNPFAVAAKTNVQLLKDGAPLFLSPTDGSSALTTQVNRFGFSAANRLTSTIHYKTMSDAATAAGTTSSAGLRGFAGGVYSAQAFFNTTGQTQVAVGASSPVVDLNNGLVADIATTDAYAIESANVDFASNSMAVRTGTNAAVVVAKSKKSDSSDIESSGIRYRAVVTAVKLSATSTVAVSGSATALAKKDDSVTVTAISDSTGKVNFTLTNAGAKKDDQVTVAVQSLKADGTFTTADTVTVTWANAALTSFAAVPGNFISGANPTLTFRTKDQFGQPISATATGALSVTVEAKIGGVTDKSKLSETKTVSNGSVEFTFANFATTAIPAQVEAVLFEGRTQSSVGASGVVVVNVYNTLATDRVTVLDVYKTDITYKDYVVGDETEVAVATAIELTGIATAPGATITGSVQNASAVGQPGAEVVVAAPGILFYDAAQGVYAQDSITIYTNEFGTYSVKAIAHTVNRVGHTVTLTSGGKSSTTLLRTYLPANELTAANLVFTWDLPAQLVKNTTYALTATLKDKWGNPIQTSGAGSVDFQGTGAVQINGVETTVSRNFDRNGNAVVFIRSIKDIAGPGSVSASIKAVASQYAIDPAVTADSLGFDQFGSLASILIDAKATAWDETKFNKDLSVVVDVLDSAPAATGKVNVGSFNGKLVVYAAGLDGAKISWKVAGRWGTAVASGDELNRFDRPVGASGVNVIVEIYVNGKKQLTKTVLTR